MSEIPAPGTVTDSERHDYTVALELPRLIERMQRRYMDLLSAALANAGAADLGPAQFLMLTHMQGGELSVRELTERGYYLGSNASYNMKQLVDGGYVERTAALRDKRTARLKLTEKGAALLGLMRERDRQIFLHMLDENGGPEACEVTYKFLRQLESRWAEALRTESADVLHFME
ncbi:MAG: MarR family transcriptional regulator [Bdellovibrionales bacterium]